MHLLQVFTVVSERIIMTKRTYVLVLAALSFAFPATPLLHAEMWPTYRHDIHRSGYSEESFTPPLSAQWTFTPPAAPRHAWGDPQPKPIEGNLELPRLRFDDAYHVAAGYGLVFFGSSADNKLYALDADSGTIRWEFFTDGPVRIAPSLWKKKLYAGSDDGHVYCLEAETGKELWRFRAAPAPKKILGNGRLISLWPVRTGIAIENGTAYFGAGVFPAEGTCLFALDAATGKLLWKNIDYGKGGLGTVSPQGYIMVSDEKLFVPSGRTMPAAFSKETGEFLFHRNFNWRGIGLFGGTYSLLSGDLLFNGTEQMLGVSKDAGSLVFTVKVRKMAASSKYVYILTGKQIAGYHVKTWIRCNRELYNLQKQISSQKNWVTTLKKRAKSNTTVADQLAREQKKLTGLTDRQKSLLKLLVEKRLFAHPCTATDALIATGTIVFAGGKNAVTGFDAETGKKVFSSDVQGTARGLAASDGKLLVSTDKGLIYCFVQGASGDNVRIKAGVSETPFPGQSEYNERAEAVVNESGVHKGFCLLLAEKDAAPLSFSLAEKTDLLIYAVVPDAARAQQAQRRLSKAGLYGTRVVIVKSAPSELHFPDYFANLILCHDRFTHGPQKLPAAELFRMLKPAGGTALIGSFETTAEKTGRLTAWKNDLDRTLKQRGDQKTQVTTAPTHLKIVRGPLPGAGSWTHQYADTGNTTCGDDTAVRGPLEILWYGDPGPRHMPSRHASNVAPLAFGGRMFVQGENILMAYDAFNGVKLWERRFPGALRTNLKRDTGNLASDGTSLFAAIGKMCIQFDPATGKTVKQYLMPDQARSSQTHWGYIAIDGGTLFGSAATEAINCRYLFAFDLETGRHLWTHRGNHIMHTTICTDDGMLFFVDRFATDAQKKQGLKNVPQTQRVDRFGKPVTPDVRMVYALNARTGAVQWERPQYVSDCVKISSGGGDLTAMYKNGILLLCGQPWNGHFWSEFFAGEFSRRSLIALSGTDGKEVWSGRKGYRSRPLIVGDTIIAEPWAHDLATGTEKKRINPVTGAEAAWQMARPGHHCGCIAASPNLLFFRSRVAAYYDLENDYGSIHFGAQRPGCWINCIPANGVVLMPEASSGCVCPFAIHCTTVFKPASKNTAWGMYSSPGPLTPVEHLAINFGAPGDRRDEDGTLWLSYPRPYTGRLVLPLDLFTQLLPGGGFVSGNSRFLSVPASPCPWVYASKVRGLQRCSIPVTGPDDPPGFYTVKLHFRPDPDKPAPAALSAIKLQGKTVARKVRFESRSGDGESGTLVKIFPDIFVEGRLTCELLSNKEGLPPDRAPFLNGIEIICTRTLPVSITTKPLELNNINRSQEQALTMRNLSGEAINGTLAIRSPENFTITPSTREVHLEPERAKTITIKASLEKEHAAAEHAVHITLSSDALLLSQKTVALHYTAERAEVTIPPSRDAHVHKKTPEQCFPDTPYLYVDGGSGKMNDSDHAISFLTFPLSIPGTPLSAELHINTSSRANSQSGDSGVIRLVTEAWDEKTLSYTNQPEIGPRIGTIGAIKQSKPYVYPLKVDLTGRKELRIALVPTSTDGSFFDSQEGPTPPKLVITYGQ